MSTTTRTPDPAGLPVPGSGSGGTSPRDLTTRAAPFLPAVPVVVAWVLWGHFDGGYFPRTWYPSALAALVVLTALVVARGRLVPASRPVAVALGLFAALVGWAYLSLLWSGSPGDGLAAANKLLLFLVTAWILALLPWSERSASVMLGLWVAGVTGVCAISLLSAQGTDRIGEFFIEGRYLDPIGYANGVSALPAMALFPALILAYRRTTPATLRPLFLAASVLLLEFSLLPQSRGSLIGLIVAVPLFVLLAPERLRLIPLALVVGGAVALAIDPLYDVYDVATTATEGTPNPPAVGPVVDDAVQAVWLTSLLALVAGVVLVLLDRAVRPGPALVHQARRGVAALMVLAALVAGGVAIAKADWIRDEVDTAWETFKSGDDTPARQGTRFTTAYADQRYDYWTVAWEAFRDRPLAGIGAGAYERRYTRDRQHEKPSRYVHDYWLRTLGELGLVGFALLIAFLAAGPGRAAWLRRRLGAGPAGVIAGVVCASAYFFVHSSFDWIDEFPALASPAFALPLVALVVARPGAPGGRRSPLTGVAGGVLAVVALAAAALALVPAYLANRYEERATRTWTADPQAAFRDLDRAADLNPLSPRPELRAATLAVDLGRLGEARRRFERSLEREDNWYAHFELALIASKQGRMKEARREIENALTLNSEDPFVSDAKATIRRGKEIDPVAFNRGIVERDRDRFTRPRN